MNNGREVQVDLGTIACCPLDRSLNRARVKDARLKVVGQFVIRTGFRPRGVLFRRPRLACRS